MPSEFNYLANIGRIVPELVICLTMVAAIFLEVTYKRKETDRPMIFYSSILGLFITGILLILALSNPSVLVFTSSFVVDPFSSFAKLTMVLGTLGTIFVADASKELSSGVKTEFTILALGVLAGGMLLTSAHNMLVLYIGIEMLSIPSYAMAFLKKHDAHSSEAGLKYALYGGVASGLMLFGMSHLFGVTGTINFLEMAQALEVKEISLAVLIPSFLFFFAGLGYKIACVPFHMWAPDVYEGSPTPVTAFFAIVPKVAGLAALLRVTHIFFSREAGALDHSWALLLQIVAVLTMTVGNVSAIGQQSVKRMLAYSSISHVGFMLLGIISLGPEGTASILFYGFVYLFMTLTAFGITVLVGDHYGSDHFERFKGLIFRYPLLTILMGITMFSLAGIPPFAGFAAKFNVIAAVVAKKYYVLAAFALLNSVVSLYYYLKIVKFMVFHTAESDEPMEGGSFRRNLGLTLAALPIVVFGIFWSKLHALIQSASLWVGP